MKLLIAKELSCDNIEKMLTLFENRFDTEYAFFDTSLNKDYSNSGAIGVDYEDRNKVHIIAVKEAISRDCQAVLFFPKNCEPKAGIVDELFQSLVDDNNITITYSDYSFNDIEMIQGKPIVICRRLEPDVEDLYDLQKTKGIVKYIPMSLYNVLLQKN